MVLETTILSNGKGHFGLTDQNNWSGQSGSFSMVVLDIPVRPTKMAYST